MAFALLLKTHAPVLPGAIAVAAGLPVASTRQEIDRLTAAGALDRDRDGAVTGSAGLSISDGPHHLDLDEGSFRTWCAYDALGIAGALHADAVVRTRCGVCQTAIEVQLVGGIPDQDTTARLWLADRGADLRRDFCTPTVLLCGDRHGEAWRERFAGRGELVTVANGTERGGQQWARCASASACL